MELNGTKIENPELFIQTIIKQLEATDLELRIAKYRLEQVQFLLNAEIKVEPTPETKVEESTAEDTINEVEFEEVI